MPPRLSKSRTALRLSGALLVAVLFAIAPGDGLAGAAGTVKNPRAEQERVRREKAAAAEKLNSLKASAKEFQDALAVVDENLRQEEAALDAARKTVAAEEQAAVALRGQQRAATDKLEGLDRILVESIIDEYIRPPFERDLFSMSSADINEALRKQALYDLTNGKNRDAASNVKALRAELERLEADRNAALERAQQARRDVEARVLIVESAHVEQARMVALADERVDNAISDIRALESLDKQIAAQLEAEARALAAAAERARRANNKPAFTPPPNSDLVDVGGIVVHRSIAANLRNLLNAASAADIDFGGSGYRDSSGQIELRRRNCGSTNFDIFQKDPFQCRPPTARPGSSNHERGLAIDFTVNGIVLTRASRGYQWLNANAGRFGFYNLPSEPWHWSSDGR